jgi:hypothetical protein
MDALNCAPYTRSKDPRLAWHPTITNTRLSPFLPDLQNLNWVNPLRRNVLTIAALINTGSLWLYEGPNAQAPAPLLVARFTNKGMNCEVQAPDVKLIQPVSDPAAGISQCQSLDGGAMRPPGVWDGGVSRGSQGNSTELYVASRRGVRPPCIIKQKLNK